MSLIDGSAPGLSLGREDASARPAALGPPLLLVDDADAARSEAALAAEGWVRKGSTWARFGAGTAERLDVVRRSELGLERLPASPTPAEELWLRALAAPQRGPSVAPEHRAAAHRVAAEDSAVWLRAHALASASSPGGAARVVALQDAYETGLPLGGAAAPGPVALSGLDGAGKSTQAHLLAAALQALGQDVAVEWSRLGFSQDLDRWVAPAKRLLRRGSAGPADAGPPVDTGARRTVQRAAAVDGAWSTVVAAAEARSVRQRQAQHAAAGRVVVRDRYLLDSLVHLEDRYGGQARTAAGRALLRAQVPSPTVALLLELPAAVAFARKPGEWSLSDLERHASRYDQVADALGVQRVDATLPPEELAARVAEQVWLRLP